MPNRVNVESRLCVRASCVSARSLRGEIARQS
jgi:hypothetical protein